MKQNIAFLFDGTDMKMSDRSNIFKLYSLLKYGVLPAENETELETKNKFVNYYEGPGSEFEEINGILFGKGFIHNIKCAYRDIANMALEDGVNLDESVLSLFGFSRGAYSARVFSHILSECGIPRDIDDCDGTVNAYLFDGKRDGFVNNIKVGKIDVLGLFDTVRSTARSFPFDGKLASNIVKCFHAMAMDENRIFFNLLKFDDAENSGKIDCQWFSGVHIDIGGGVKAAGKGLSNITLSWMIEKCSAEGVNFPKIVSLEKGSDFSNSATDTIILPVEICAEITNNSDLPEISARTYEGETLNSAVLKRIKLMGDKYATNLKEFVAKTV